MVQKYIHEALTIGLKSKNDIIDHVFKSTIKNETVKPCLLEDEHLDKLHFSYAVTNYAKTLAYMPRGHFVILSFTDNGRKFWKALISDGSGDELLPESFALYTHRPTFAEIFKEMLTVEVERSLPIVSRLYFAFANNEVIERNKLQQGGTIKNVQVPGYKRFSSAVIVEITHSGHLTLSGRYRGSSRIYKVTVPASSLQINH